MENNEKEQKHWKQLDNYEMREYLRQDRPELYEKLIDKKAQEQMDQICKIGQNLANGVKVLPGKMISGIINIVKFTGTKIKAGYLMSEKFAKKHLSSSLEGIKSWGKTGIKEGMKAQHAGMQFGKELWQLGEMAKNELKEDLQQTKRGILYSWKLVTKDLPKGLENKYNSSIGSLNKKLDNFVLAVDFAERQAKKRKFLADIKKDIYIERNKYIAARKHMEKLAINNPELLEGLNKNLKKLNKALEGIIEMQNALIDEQKRDKKKQTYLSQQKTLA